MKFLSILAPGNLNKIDLVPLVQLFTLGSIHYPMPAECDIKDRTAHKPTNVPSTPLEPGAKHCMSPRPVLFLGLQRRWTQVTQQTQWAVIY